MVAGYHAQDASTLLKTEHHRILEHYATDPLKFISSGTR